MFPPVFDAESVLSQLTSSSGTTAAAAADGSGSGNGLSPNRRRKDMSSEAKVEVVLDPWLIEAEAALLILLRQVRIIVAKLFAKM